MKWRNELISVFGILVVLAVLSFGHRAWGGVPLASVLQHQLFSLLGGSMAAQSSSRGPDPLVAVLGQENERLHQQLALRARLPGVVQFAQVVRREPETWWTSVEVELALSTQGPPPSHTAVVLTPQGLIGTLEGKDLVMVEQGPQSYYRGTVHLLSSPETQLSVTVGQNEAPFLLEGRGGPEFAMRPVTSGAEKTVEPGDAVQTSGLGRLYSKGLQVAVVGGDLRWAGFSSCASTPAEVVLWWR